MRLQASGPRRAVMLTMMAAMGILLVLLGFQMDGGAFLFKAAFVVIGLGFLSLLPATARASARYLVLTKAGLTDDQGTLLVAVENVRSVERGAFAFKPSNGFLVRLHQAQPRAWVPGLWWMQGRQMGVGGIIPSGAAKSAAEILVSMSPNIK